MRKTTTKGRSGNLGRAFCEVRDVQMSTNGYNYAKTEFENEQHISQLPENAPVILYNVEYANTSCI
jgi:hypothetical protein